jgi:hypothetical protein
MGPRLDRYPVAVRPEGVTVAASGRQGSIQGELLEVRDTAMVLLVTPVGGGAARVVLLPYAAIREARLLDMDKKDMLRDGQPPAASQSQRFRRLSRFPQGLSEALLRQLLDAHGQAELERIPE